MGGGRILFTTINTTRRPVKKEKKAGVPKRRLREGCINWSSSVEV